MKKQSSYQKLKAMRQPETFLDADGYPTSEYLDWIYEFKPFRNCPVEFIKIIQDNYMCDGIVIKRKYKGAHTVELHTYGWSGNEEIVSALERNCLFWTLYWRKTERGGHYYFNIKKK